MAAHLSNVDVIVNTKNKDVPSCSHGKISLFPFCNRTISVIDSLR